MPDFDMFERRLRRFLAQPAGSLAVEQAAVDLAALPSVNRPTTFKQMSAPALVTWHGRAREVLAELCGHADPVLETSDDNRAGKDLVDRVSGRSFELKASSFQTHANSGVKLISWATGIPHPGPLALLNSSMTERRAAFRRGDMGAVNASKRATMHSVAAAFRAALPPGSVAPPTLAHYFFCVGLGYTKEKEIVDAWNKAKRYDRTQRPTEYLEMVWCDRPIIVVCDAHAGLTLATRTMQIDEEIVVTESGSVTPDGRTNLRLRGSRSGTSMNIYPHYKNSLVASGVRIPADCWVNTACFNVWIHEA